MKILVHTLHELAHLDEIWGKYAERMVGLCAQQEDRHFLLAGLGELAITVWDLGSYLAGERAFEVVVLLGAVGDKEGIDSTECEEE